MLRCSCWDYFFVPHKGYIRIFQVSFSTDKKHGFLVRSSCPFSLLKTIQGTNYLYWEDNCYVDWTVRPFERMVSFKMLPVSLTGGIRWVFLSHPHMFLLDYKVKSLSALAERSTERQLLVKVPELWTWRLSCPDPCQGIPDKLQLYARVILIKMSLRTPCRWRQSLHKSMGHLWDTWESAFCDCRKLIMGHLRKERRQGRRLI